MLFRYKSCRFQRIIKKIDGKVAQSAKRGARWLPPLIVGTVPWRVYLWPQHQLVGLIALLCVGNVTVCVAVCTIPIHDE